MHKPLVFITNDDGYFAKGINELVRLLTPFCNIVMLAPDQSRSGFSCAFTFNVPLHITKVTEREGTTIYYANGTPTDCAKLAFFKLFQHQKPDLVISGINHGSNASVNAIYSGTVGAAIEGCVNNVPSIAFSLCSIEKDPDFSYALPLIEKIVRYVLQNGLPTGTFLNVNFPEGAIKGWKICREADAYWSEEFNESTNAEGKEVFTIAGKFINREPLAEETDLWALEHNYASIVPMLTNRSNISYIQTLKKNLK